MREVWKHLEFVALFFHKLDGTRQSVLEVPVIPGFQRIVKRDDGTIPYIAFYVCQHLFGTHFLTIVTCYQIPHDNTVVLFQRVILLESHVSVWRAEKIVSRSVKAGFNWDSAAGALDKLDEETAELRQAVETGQPVDSPHGIREELGDALFILCKIAQMSGVDPEDALHRACDKYQGRFRRVADAADRPLNAYTEAEKIALWEQAKEN